MLKTNFFKDQIAVILLIGAFSAIVIILASHMYISGSIINEYSKANDTMRMNLANFYKDINASNLTIYSIIFSLFGAWVGAVLAFYFGAQSLERAHDSLNKAQSSINQIVSDNRMLGVTVKEIIDKNPNCRDIKPFTFDSLVADIVKGAKEKNYRFVMIGDNETNPTKVSGLLFMDDLKKDKSEKELEVEPKKLKEYLDDPQTSVIDGITKQKWSSQPPGVQNFVSTSLDENLNTLYDKMIKKDPSLSVRGVVFENSKAIATITYENILSTIQK